MNLKPMVKRLVPIGVFDLIYRLREARQMAEYRDRRARMDRLRGSVSKTISAIRHLTSAECSNVNFLEHTFIPSLGLNNEMLHEQPAELSSHYGTGLHIWQYPNQLARYLAWLSRNAGAVNCYMEIGCRWGGMFILVAEWLRKSGAGIHTVIAVDPIEPSPFIDEYFKFLENEKKSEGSKIQTIYAKELSTAPEVRRLVEQIRPDFVFIDGGHSLGSALTDHMLVREHANVIVHHDISSQACSDIALLWSTLKQLEIGFEFFEFTDQYKSVGGNFLGIGVMKRRSICQVVA